MLGNRKNQQSQAKVPDIGISRSQFDRSFTLKDTFDFDYLVPIFVDEILPGDTCNVKLNTFARLATPKVPVMDNMFIDYFFFFVPNRLVFENWEKLNGAQTNPGDSTDYVLPTMPFPAGGPEVGTIYDKFGLPTDVTNAWTLKNTLPLRAYNLIWNEWFRDQNLQNSIVVPTDNGPDAVGDFALLKRNKKHDYFTSALPSPQKGPAVELPLGSSAPVLGLGKFNGNFTNGPTNFRESDGVTRSYATSAFIDASSNDMTMGVQQSLTNPGFPNIRADLSNATAATINQLREAFAMQSLFELDMRGGTRYVEILRAHFNVISPDFRLQRPEYLGGGQTRINSHPVAQTAPTSGANPQGQLAAFATSSSSGQNIGFTKSFVEHGYVIGLACARADLTYQQGLNRMWNRSTRYDFFWPELANLGEQAVLSKEIYLDGSANDDLVFGYQERNAEYRYKPSEIHGEFRSTYSASLDFWHMAEEFGTRPSLNATFIEQNTPIERAIAITSEPHLLFDAWFQYKHARPIPVYSVPAKLGGF